MNDKSDPRLDELLAASVLPALPEALVSPSNLEPILAIARAFPSALTDSFGFECPLAEPEARADFSFCATVADGGRDVLAGSVPGNALSAALLAHPVWRRVRGFAERWADPDTRLHDRTDNVWFEFDVETPAPTLPVPSVFFGSTVIRPLIDVSWVMEEAFASLFGQAPDAALARRFRTSVAALPLSAAVFQVGAMLARSSDAIRICVSNLGAEEKLRYLAAVGWPGSLNEARSVVTNAHRLAGSVALDLDLGSSVGSKIGLECAFQRDAASQARAGAMVERLVALGLCSPEKGSGLLACTSPDHAGTEPEAHAQRERSRLTARHATGGFARWVSHVKLVYQPGAPLAAKAYVAVRHIH